MADEYKPQQGDEAELFALYNDQLMRRVARVVRTSPDIIEDACSIAWAQFLRHQPDRNREWRAWLSGLRSAKRGFSTPSVARRGPSRTTRATAIGSLSLPIDVTRSPSATSSRRQSTSSRNSRRDYVALPSY